MLIIGFVLMMALPVAYRIWLIYHPCPDPPVGTTFMQLLEKTSEERTIRLLRTPVEKWSADSRNVEPCIYAWLNEHKSTILPWEWSEQARQKDPEGYRRLWEILYRELNTEFKSRLRAGQKKLKQLDKEHWINDSLYNHRTNQIARIVECNTTNTYPMTISVERLSKGVLWGWNKKNEMVILTNQASRIAWVQTENNAIQLLKKDSLAISSSREIALRRNKHYDELCRRTTYCLMIIKENDVKRDNGIELERELIKLLQSLAE